jgi:hypothetical protein
LRARASGNTLTYTHLVYSYRHIHTQVARKRKEREIMYEKKQDLVRPLKKRKAAPNQKFSDVPGTAGVGPQVSVWCGTRRRL